MDFDSAGDSGDSAVSLHRWRTGDAPVELAAPATLRLAPAHLLASAWTSRPLPHPLRRIWTPSFRSLQFPPSHARALRANDPGRPGTLSPRHTRRLGLRPTR